MSPEWVIVVVSVYPRPGMGNPVYMLVSTPGQATLLITCSVDTGNLRRVRSEIKRWLKFHHLPLDSWDVVATELMCNAFAANTGEAVEIEMRLIKQYDQPRLTCSVTNSGVWNLQTTESAIAIDSIIERASPQKNALPSGRGLRLVRGLTSGGKVSVEDGTTCVTVWQDLPFDQSSAIFSDSRFREHAMA